MRKIEILFENMDKIKERKKKYRDTHKEEIKEKKRLYYIKKKNIEN